MKRVLLQKEWVQVRVPVPFSLKWVNSYLIPEERGYTLIDPGLRTDDAISVWSEVLQDLELKWTDIVKIVLTHQHPDHYGLAGYVQERSGAPVYITKEAHAYARRLWGADSHFSEQLQVLYAQHGMPIEQQEEIAENLKSFVSMVSPQPEVTYFEAGSHMMIGSQSWLLIDAPGHARGQVCFYQQDLQWMLCGDQVLPRITPNVSVVPGEDGDPLGDFLSSLEQLKQFEVKLAFPGHRDPFTNFAGRIAELEEHHLSRLDKMAALLAEEPRSAYRMCEALFGSRLGGNAHQLRFAMSETLAHLVYLEKHARISSANVAGIFIYSALPA
ncbi:MBL fold metallo-hydrolase [Paenibacillus sp. FSL H8-0548]|nr:MBL fold metallo-hydrolase [Paenibacillus sp. FSL H8-0548]